MAKRMLTKFAAEMDAECPLDVAVDFVVQAINSMDQVGQHSPFEHLLGRGGSDVTRNILGMSEGGPAQLREERRLLDEPSLRWSIEHVSIELCELAAELNVNGSVDRCASSGA